MVVSMDDTVFTAAPPAGSHGSGGSSPQQNAEPVGTQLDVDENEGLAFSDSDSALGDISRTTSYAGSLKRNEEEGKLTNYRWENGRRYHAFDPTAYDLPNDEAELDRLDLQHHIWRMTLNGALYLSPIPQDCHNVLDVGTGTGIWAIEFAEEHPNTAVCGTDLSPVQPAFVPPNCRFLIDNAELEWVFQERFDFIHSRMLFLGMKNWQNYFKQCFQHLQPGGWLEVQEICFPCEVADDSIRPEDSKCIEWSNFMINAGEKIGMDPTSPLRFQEYLEAQGFVNIRKERVGWPFGPWPLGAREKKIGAWHRENSLQGIQGASMGLFTRHLGWSPEQVELYIVDVRKEIKDSTKHLYVPAYIYCAQKPE